MVYVDTFLFFFGIDGYVQMSEDKLIFFQVSCFIETECLNSYIFILMIFCNFIEIRLSVCLFKLRIQSFLYFREFSYAVSLNIFPFIYVIYFRDTNYFLPEYLICLPHYGLFLLQSFPTLSAFTVILLFQEFNVQLGLFSLQFHLFCSMLFW